MKKIMILPIIVIFICLCGCNMKKNVIGTWEREFVPIKLNNIRSVDTYTFKSDGTCIEYLKGYYIDTGKEESVQKYNYKWSIRGNKLILIDQDNEDEGELEYELIIGNNVIYIEGDKYIKQ